MDWRAAERIRTSTAPLSQPVSSAVADRRDRDLQRECAHRRRAGSGRRLPADRQSCRRLRSIRADRPHERRLDRLAERLRALRVWRATFISTSPIALARTRLPDWPTKPRDGCRISARRHFARSSNARLESCGTISRRTRGRMRPTNPWPRVRLTASWLFSRRVRPSDGMDGSFIRSPIRTDFPR